jgi:hypothetical protein
VPYNSPCGGGNCGATWTNWAESGWVNVIQPYEKNFQTFVCPDASPTPTIYAAAAGGPAAQKTSYTYNGLLQSYPQAGVNVPAQLPLITESFGRAGYTSGYLSNPVLECTNPAQMSCSYVPAGGSGNGSSSGWFGFEGIAAVHANGQTWAYADGHVKYKSLSVNTALPATTSWHQEPWVYYSAGFPQSAWSDGYHIWYFRPDYNFE